MTVYQTILKGLLILFADTYLYDCTGNIPTARGTKMTPYYILYFLFDPILSFVEAEKALDIMVMVHYN